MLCCLPFLLMAGRKQAVHDPAVGNDRFTVKEANYEEDAVI